MMKRFAVMAIMALIAVITPSAVMADTLEIAPAINKGIELDKGEKKKGFVDIANPTASTARIKLTVQAFKQTDTDGSLEFYDSEQVRAGVKLDLNDFSLGPKETIRVYYLLDGTKLPTGTVFAAILAQQQQEDTAVAQSLRVGSLLSITNGTPTPRTATVKSVSAPFLQLGEGMVVTADVANESDDPNTTGVFPLLEYNFWPYGSSQAEGPLVFKGNVRSVEYRKPGNYLGLVRVSVSAGENEKTTYVFAITGVWQWLFPLIVGVVVASGIGFALYKKRRA